MAAAGGCYVLFPHSSISCLSARASYGTQGISSTQNLYYHHQKIHQARDGRFNVLLRDIGPAKVQTLSSQMVAVGDHEKLQFGRAATATQQRQIRREVASRNWSRAQSRSTKWWRCYCNSYSAWEETYADVISTSSNCNPTLDSSLPSHHFGKLKFWIITVKTSAELLAAATLRAQLFYSYPKDTSTGTEGVDAIKDRLKHQFHMRDLMKSRVKSEFERDTKMQSLNMNVQCLLAVCEKSHHEELLLSSEEDRNLLMMPPAVAPPAFSSRPSVAIGTLDIQDGTGTKATVDVNTITFQLFNIAHTQKKKHANRPKVSEPGRGHSLLSFTSYDKSQVKHGYIFNLCVNESVRRHGVATALMREAVHTARKMQLQHLYVHVDAGNISALALYEKLGYIVEEEEPFDVERRFHRPRRILLSYRFQ